MSNLSVHRAPTERPLLLRLRSYKHSAPPQRRQVSQVCQCLIDGSFFTRRNLCVLCVSAVMVFLPISPPSRRVREVARRRDANLTTNDFPVGKVLQGI